MTIIPNSDLKEIRNSLGPQVYRFSGKCILITGGAGFLGRCFISFFKYLNTDVLTTKCKIICLDNYISCGNLGELVNGDTNVEVIRHDVIIPLGLKIKHDQKIDFIISAAGIASPQQYTRYPVETLDVSYLGTKHMLELAYYDQVESMLAFSSSEVYATPPADMIPTPETFCGNLATMSERSCYDIGKTVIEALIHVYHKSLGVSGKVVRPFNVYGAGMSQNDFRVVPNFINSILKRETIKVYGNGKQTRTFCYLSDAICGFIKVLLNGKNGEVYNIGNDKPEVTIAELASILKSTVAPQAEIEVIDYPSNYPKVEPLRRCPDLTKSRTELDYEPVVTLEDGLSRYYKWASENYTY